MGPKVGLKEGHGKADGYNSNRTETGYREALLTDSVNNTDSVHTQYTRQIFIYVLEMHVDILCRLKSSSD